MQDTAKQFLYVDIKIPAKYNQGLNDSDMIFNQGPDGASDFQSRSGKL